MVPAIRPASLNAGRIRDIYCWTRLTVYLIPAGEDDVDLDYHSRFFLPGALITLITLLTCVGVLVWRPLRLKTAKAVAAT